jgi:hypothetical protein
MVLIGFLLCQLSRRSSGVRRNAAKVDLLSLRRGHGGISGGDQGSGVVSGLSRCRVSHTPDAVVEAAPVSQRIR